MDRLDRRYFLWTGALFIAGCQAPGRRDSLPEVAWPDVGGRPAPGGNDYVPDATSSRSGSSSSRSHSGSGTPRDPYQRAAWTRAQPRQSNINAMNGIRRITLHHEGFPDPFTATSRTASAERVERIRASHTNRGWADIGYHYIIDRGGRVWEGRPVRYQGAHVGGHNEHNIGVMCLGNFDIQSPSEAQVDSLQKVVRLLRRRHNVPENEIHTHRELGPTACPGRNLQPRITAMRHNRQFT